MPRISDDEQLELAVEELVTLASIYHLDVVATGAAQVRIHHDGRGWPGRRLLRPCLSPASSSRRRRGSRRRTWTSSTSSRSWAPEADALVKD